MTLVCSGTRTPKTKLYTPTTRMLGTGVMVCQHSSESADQSRGSIRRIKLKALHNKIIPTASENRPANSLP